MCRGGTSTNSVAIRTGRPRVGVGVVEVGRGWKRDVMVYAARAGNRHRRRRRRRRLTQARVVLGDSSGGVRPRHQRESIRLPLLLLPPPRPSPRPIHRFSTARRRGVVDTSLPPGVCVYVYL